jgi:hypothetical protein
MKRLPPFFRWLTIAALLDWLIARTITRSAMLMPKSPPVIMIYQALGAIGQVALTLTGLLALIALVWIARRERASIVVFMLFIIRAALSLLFIVVAPTGWWAVADHALTLVIVSYLLARMWRAPTSTVWKLALSLPALALLLGVIYQMLPALATALSLPAAPPWTGAVFNLGEALVALSPIGLWWIIRRDVAAKTYAIALLPAVAFAIAHTASPAMTNIITIWSIGLTLFLPWPVYAISLWLCGVIAIGSIRRGQPIGWALLMLAAGGYAPQLSTHAFLGLIALWLMSDGLAQRATTAKDERTVLSVTARPLHCVPLTPCPRRSRGGALGGMRWLRSRRIVG